MFRSEKEDSALGETAPLDDAEFEAALAAFDAGDSSREDDAARHAPVVGLLELDLRLPLCRSLKAKRGILARTTNGLRKAFPVSVSEVGDRNAWERSGLAVAVVSGDAEVVERTLRSAVEWVERGREVELLRFSIQLL